MEVSKVGYWLQVGANVGILVGLVLVGLQMNQNAALLRIQLLKQEADSYVATEMAIAGENFAESWARIQEQPEKVSLKDMRVMESDLWGLSVYKWINAYQLHKHGLLSEEDWKREVDLDLDFGFGNPYARGWWDAFAEGYGNTNPVPREVFEYADARIKDLPLDATARHFERVRRHTAKYLQD